MGIFAEQLLQEIETVLDVTVFLLFILIGLQYTLEILVGKPCAIYALFSR